MALFSQDFLQEVMARNPLEDVVGRYVALKRAGNTLKGLCPFHREKTPSFSVSLDKQLYYCFGCGKGGTVFNFIMQQEGFDFVETVTYLAERAGMEMPAVSEDGHGGPTKEERQRLFELNKEAALYYHNKLLSPEGARQLGYLWERDISNSTIKRFALGYAPDNDEIIEVLKDKGFTDDEILKAGITAQGDNGREYRRFRNRVMFPIVDRRRNVIAFGGRIVGEGEPKYLNSSDTVLFDKGKNLYGFNFAGRSKDDYLVLVEGYFDVIALHQSGIDSAVASLGTALTPWQARIIKRCKNEVVISYDSDAAGQNATEKAIEILSQEGLRVRVLTQKECKDPDEFIKRFGVGAFRALINESALQLDYKIRKMREKYDLTKADDKVNFVKELAGELSRLESEVEREVYAGKIAEESGVSLGAIQSEIDRCVNNNKNKARLRARFSIERPVLQGRDGMAERLLLGLMCQDVGIVPRVFERLSIDDFGEGKYREIARKLRDGGDAQGLIADPEFAGEVSEVLFCFTKMDDVETGLSELVKGILAQRRRERLAKASEAGDIELVNELLSEAQKV